MTMTNTCKESENASFLSRALYQTFVIAKAIESPGNSQKKREIHRCVWTAHTKKILTRLQSRSVASFVKKHIFVGDDTDSRQRQIHPSPPDALDCSGPDKSKERRCCAIALPL